MEMTPEEFASRYAVQVQREEFISGVWGVSGKNGGINIFESGEYDVVVVTLGWFERWGTKLRLASAGLKIKEQDKLDFDRNLSVEAYFDPENAKQVLLAIELARIPLLRTPLDIAQYLMRAGWTEGEPPADYRRREQRWQDPLAPERWFRWQDALGLQRSRDKKGIGKAIRSGT